MFLISLKKKERKCIVKLFFYRSLRVRWNLNHPDRTIFHAKTTNEQNCYRLAFQILGRHTSSEDRVGHCPIVSLWTPLDFV